MYRVYLILALVLFLTPPARAELLSRGAFQELVERGEYDQALESLQRESSLYPYNDLLRRNLAAAYVEIAQREMKHGRFSGAARYLAQAQELFPENREYIVARGIALYLAKEYPAAKSELERAGESVEALIFRGRVAYDTGELATAVELWRRAQELDPANHAVKGLLQKAEREMPVESRMDRGFSSMFDLSFDAEVPSGLTSEVMDALESAYSKIGSDFGLFPSTRLPVLLYTKSDYRSVTEGPDWSGGLYDGKIRLPIGSLSRMTPPLRAILFHEYTHVVIGVLTGGNIPTWLNEGLAEYEGRKEFAPPLLVLDAAAKKHALLPLRTVAAPFTGMGGGTAQLAYQQSYDMVDFMITNYGWDRVREILKSLGERTTPEQAFQKALAGWALDLPGFFAQWQQSRGVPPSP